LLVVLLVAAAGCARGGGAGRADDRTSACERIAELDGIAGSVAAADLSDPAAFERTLDDAVARYVATVERLRPVVPETLRPDLDRHAAAVEQHRFADASGSRASLDSYAATTCGAAPAPTTVP
jgi:hypothetical protein